MNDPIQSSEPDFNAASPAVDPVSQAQNVVEKIRRELSKLFVGKKIWSQRHHRINCQRPCPRRKPAWPWQNTAGQSCQ